MSDPLDRSWMDEAECKDLPVEMFFPERERGGDPKPAQAVCFQCPVRVRCLAYALAAKEKQGIWGGKSERQRRHIRQAMAIARAAGEIITVESVA